MRTLSFILAFAFVLAGPSMAGSSDSGLPGVGTFAYNGLADRRLVPQADGRCGPLKRAELTLKESCR